MEVVPPHSGALALDWVLESKEAGEGIQLDRWANESLFAACERIMGAKVPDYIQKKTFPADIIRQAKASA